MYTIKNTDILCVCVIANRSKMFKCDFELYFAKQLVLMLTDYVPDLQQERASLSNQQTHCNKISWDSLDNFTYHKPMIARVVLLLLKG